MVINSFKKLFFISSVLVILVLVSCQKEVDIDLDNPPPIPGEVKDSTLLIKSIGLTLYDLNTGLAEDSIIEYYSYDSINRKVILTWDDVSGEFPVGSLAELSYNTNGLLSHITYKYPSGYVPSDEDKSVIDLEYDPDKVLQKITFKFYNGNSATTIFNKTSLSSGKYQLSWLEPSYFDDSLKLQVVFGTDGKQVVSSIAYSYATVIDGNGNGQSYTQIIAIDSLIYDANGSISKVTTNYIDTLRHINETFTTAEFISRQSKGDQLYNQRQAVLNGIANIPLGNDLFGGFAGILSFFPDDLELMEYSKFPFQTAKIYNSLTKTYDNANGISEFDNKSRLIKFRGFYNDADLIPCEWKISYYK